MPLADYDAYVAALRNNRVADFQVSATLGRALRPAAAWPTFLPAPTTPTTSVALNSDSAEAIGPIPAVGSGRLTVLGARMTTAGVSGVAVLLIDLLNLSGGLSGTVTTAQTTNLPTAALTRYTNGEGVMAALIVHSAVGSAATTVTASYTNTVPTSGRTTTATAFGGTTHNVARSFIPLPLEAGDTGVRSVESVTVAATTGAAGNFGVALFRPLAMLPLNDVQSAMPIDAVSTGGMSILPEVVSGACLTVVAIANTAQIIGGAVILGEV